MLLKQLKQTQTAKLSLKYTESKLHYLIVPHVNNKLKALWHQSKASDMQLEQVAHRDYADVGL